jgi:hypothetical protein
MPGARESRALLQDDQEALDLVSYMLQAKELMQEDCISLLVPLMVFDIPLFDDPTKVSFASDNVYASLHDLCCAVFAKRTNPYLMRKPHVFTAMRGWSKYEIIVHSIVKAMTTIGLSKATNDRLTDTGGFIERCVSHKGLLLFTYYDTILIRKECQPL